MSNWWPYRSFDWSNRSITVNPAYFSYFNCPRDGYYQRFYGGYNRYNWGRTWAPTSRSLNNFNQFDLGNRITHYRSNLGHNLNINRWNTVGVQHNGIVSPFNSRIVHPQSNVGGGMHPGVSTTESCIRRSITAAVIVEMTKNVT